MEKELQYSGFKGLRIVLFGPESTGKTTLAKQLAAHFQTQWVPEFARDFLQYKWDTTQEVCTRQDLLTITQGQLALENKKAKKAQDFLFCDTNIRVTQVWSETHFDGFCDPQIRTLADQLRYDHYLLTDIDVPWEADDLRDRPNNRLEMKQAFQQHLIQNNCKFSSISGNPEQRLQQAIKLLEGL